METYVLKKCPDCDGHGRVNVEDEEGRSLGIRLCPNPVCRQEPKPGYILVKKEEKAEYPFTPPHLDFIGD